MSKTSSSNETPRAPAWRAAGIDRLTRVIIAMLLATSTLAVSFATAPAADLPMPPLPQFESEAPVGLILDKPVADEPLAEKYAELVADEEFVLGPTRSVAASVLPTSETATEIQLTAADVSATQADGKNAAEKDKQEHRDKQEHKDRDAAKNACGDQAKDCKQALKNLRDDGIETIALDIRVGGRPGSDYPCECRLEGETFQPRRFATTMMTWKAAGNCHKPLYFEDWNLERYGHSHGPLDPVFSAAHFFVTLPVLPYKMGVELPWECVYPLGYYRPGSCAPWTVPAPPISCRGFAVEAATVTGLVFLLP